MSAVELPVTAQSPGRESVQILPRTVNVEGKDIIVQLLKMGSEEGMLSTHVQKMLGLSPDAFRMNILRNGLEYRTLSSESKSELRNVGLVAKQGALPRFIPSSTIKEVMRLINTPQSKAAYYQLWGMAEDTKVHMAVKLEAAGSPENMLKLLNMNDELSRSLRIAVTEQIEMSKKLAASDNDRLRLVKDLDHVTESNMQLINEVVVVTKEKTHLKNVLTKVDQVKADISDEVLTPTQMAKLHAIKMSRYESDKVGGRISGFNQARRWMPEFWKHVNIAAHSNSIKEIRQRHFENAVAAAKEYSYVFRKF